MLSKIFLYTTERGSKTMQRAEELLPIVQIQTRSNTVPVYALPHETASICPECNRTIPALVFERDEKIWLTKTCPEHGICEELYFGSARMFKKFAKYFHDGKGIDNPNVPL